MPFPRTFASTRTTTPDRTSLITQLQALDPTATLISVAPPPELPSAYIIDKATAWTTPQINAAQNVLNTSPAVSPQLTAQAAVDQWGIEYLSLADTLLDEINILRVQLGLTARTRAQGIAAIRTKARQWTP